ncbi:hypothetical protein [Dactylosporangium sp. NPDC006015]|uniref:DUF6915 family protein n=1 Tax=Dactylosporangium sp. NPDC006015 TaxID=3154576 RepID=UPI0033A79D98
MMIYIPYRRGVAGAGERVNSWHHAVSAARKWGGTPEDYIEIEEFIDSSKKLIGDVRHRSLYHHTEGVWLCQRIFGRTIEVSRSTGGTIQVPVRLIAERHVLEDLGWLPSPADYIAGMPIAPWMSGAQRKQLPLSHLLQGEPRTEEPVE